MDKLAHDIGMAVIGIVALFVLTAIGMTLKWWWDELYADLNFKWRKWRGKK